MRKDILRKPGEAQQHTIECAFCKGSGRNPHFKGTCSSCNGEGHRLVTGKYKPCRDCHQTGRKGGTTLTCYTCGGLGMIPDVSAVMEQARQELQKGRRRMEEEKYPAR